jgi:hypothetical protein
VGGSRWDELKSRSEVVTDTIPKGFEVSSKEEATIRSSFINCNIARQTPIQYVLKKEWAFLFTVLQ